MGYRTLLSDKVVEILNNKDKFREFLKTNGFNTHIVKCYDNMKKVLSEMDSFKLSIILKLIDSAVSRDVS
jgi:hypothetical protein